MKEKAPTSTLHSQNGRVYTDKNKAEAFANSLEDQCSPNYYNLDEDHVRLVDRTVTRYININVPEFSTPAEVLEILQHLNIKKAPGPDNISNVNTSMSSALSMSRRTRLNGDPITLFGEVGNHC